MPIGSNQYSLVGMIGADMKRSIILRIYVAGPISIGDTETNINRGIEAGIRLIKDGMIPYIPHLNGKLRKYDPFPDWHEGILDYEMQWLDTCDVLYRLGGESVGAEIEVRYARSIGIPVFYEDQYNELLEYARGSIRGR